MAKMTETLKRHIWCIFIIAVLVPIVIFQLPSKSNDRTLEDIAEYTQKLQTILNDEPIAKKRVEKLIELAKEVGAGYVNTKIVDSNSRKVGPGIETNIYKNSISEAELSLNIHSALQTKTMIYMCNIAAKNFQIAKRVAFAAIVSAFAALASALFAKRKT